MKQRALQGMAVSWGHKAADKKNQSEAAREQRQREHRYHNGGKFLEDAGFPAPTPVSRGE